MREELRSRPGDTALPAEVYLDHNASSPLRPEAARAMRAILRMALGNPASVHAAGRRARSLLEDARASIAAAIGAAPRELVFTSGGTESNHLALHGLLEHSPRRALAVSAVEHPSVLRPAARLGAQGHPVRTIVADRDGRVLPAAVAAQLDDALGLVSVQWANHELGTLQPIEEIGGIVRATSAVLHVDAAQALGRVAVDVRAARPDALTLSAHKLGGPPGIGALYVREGVELSPQHRGGSQEFERRAGTPSVLLAAGFAAALTAALAERERIERRQQRLRESLFAAMTAAVPDVLRNSPASGVLPNTLNVAFPRAARDALLVNLDLAGFRVSAGAACASGALEPSAVLRAVHEDPERSACALRISLGPRTNALEIDAFVRALAPAVARAREAARFF